MVKFLQLKTILPIYAPDGRYIEAWQALYELSLPLAPAQDSLSRPPRVLLEGEYLSLELRGAYLAKAVFAHLPVQARRGSDLFAERFTQPTAMLFKRVNGRFLAPFFMGENGASPACKEAVAVDSIGLMRAKSALPEPTACTKMIVVEPQTLKHPSQEEPKGSAVIQINAEYRLVTSGPGAVYYKGVFNPFVFNDSMRQGNRMMLLKNLPSRLDMPEFLERSAKELHYEVSVKFNYHLKMTEGKNSYSLLDCIHWQEQCPCSRGVVLDYDSIKPKFDLLSVIKAQFEKGYKLKGEQEVEKWRLEMRKLRARVRDELLKITYEFALEERLRKDSQFNCIYLNKTFFNVKIYNEIYDLLSDILLKNNKGSVKIITNLDGDMESDCFDINSRIGVKPWSLLVPLAETVIMGIQAFSLDSNEVISSHSFALGFNTFASHTYFGRNERNYNDKIVLFRSAVKDSNDLFPATGILVHEVGHNAAESFHHNNVDYGYTKEGLQSAYVKKISPSIHNIKGILNDEKNRLSMDSW